MVPEEKKSGISFLQKLMKIMRFQTENKYTEPVAGEKEIKITKFSKLEEKAKAIRKMRTGTRSLKERKLQTEEPLFPPVLIDTAEQILPAPACSAQTGEGGCLNGYTYRYIYWFTHLK